MPAKDATTPRVFLIRHGETEWSKNGRYTGITDLPLLPEGESRIRQTGSLVVGERRLIDPTNKLRKVYCSPRQRARRTCELLFPGTSLQQDSEDEKLDHEQVPQNTSSTGGIDIEITENIREWSYGDYEGLFTSEIHSLRKSRGHDKSRKWDIWLDGTEGPGSESPEQITVRLDELIRDITSLQKKWMDDGENRSDIVVVAHGHILRAFVKRWLGLELGFKLELMLEPGGVCGLSYAHGKIEERAVLVGMGYPNPGIL